MSISQRRSRTRDSKERGEFCANVGGADFSGVRSATTQATKSCLALSMFKPHFTSHIDRASKPSGCFTLHILCPLLTRRSHAGQHPACCTVALATLSITCDGNLFSLSMSSCHICSPTSQRRQQQPFFSVAIAPFHVVVISSTPSTNA